MKASMEKEHRESDFSLLDSKSLLLAELFNLMRLKNQNQDIFDPLMEYRVKYLGWPQHKSKPH